MAHAWVTSATPRRITTTSFTESSKSTPRRRHFLTRNNDDSNNNMIRLFSSSRDKHIDNRINNKKDDIIKNNDEMTNHMFVDYDKPLVLLGCSGAGDELQRLATAFVRQSSFPQQQEASVTTAATAAQQVLLLQQEEEEQLLQQQQRAGERNDSNTQTTTSIVPPGMTSLSASPKTATAAAGIVPLIGHDATQGWFVLPLDDLKRAISLKKYAWPDVIVVDLSLLDDYHGNTGSAGGDPTSDRDMSALEFYFTQAMKLLYDELQLLCLYVNVNGTASNMKLATRRRHERMESTMVQYSDYELCIQQEGLDPATIVAQQLLDMSLQQQQQHEENDGPIDPNNEQQSKTSKKNTILDSMCDPLAFTTTLDTNRASPEAKAMLQQAIQQQEQGWNHIEWELQRLVARARLTSPLPGDGSNSSSTTSTTAPSIIQRADNCAHLTMGPHTFFLSLSVPHVKQVQPYIADMCRDVDALEYRTDLLQDRNSRFQLLYGMQRLRYYCRPHVVRVPALPCPNGNVLEDVMPIVYTVRTCHQAGTYPDDPEVGIPNMFTLLTWGLRGGVEVLDVESAWDPHRTTQLLDLVHGRYASQILGSHHVVGSTVTLEKAVALFQQCALQGRAHGAKLVLSIDSEKQDRMAYEAGLISTSLARASQTQPVIPHIALILGKIGQYSRILNFPFTPVTHESLPTPAAPGQLTANEILATRLLTKMLRPKRYCILGHNIAYSVSPQMHNAAFAATRLPHHYHRADVAAVEEFCSSDFFQASEFGGASVTIPHKQAIIPYVDVMSEAAQAIGSVNTLIVEEEIQVEEGNGADGSEGEFKRVVYGDNTDWRGIYKPLQRKLGKKVNPETDVCLIVGAGGTARAAAYAAQKLGLQRIYYNRTPEKAQELADAFGGRVLSTLDEQGGLYKDNNSLGQVLGNLGGGNGDQAIVRVVISTLPAAANFELPNWMFKAEKQKPIVFDVNYKPFYTQLLLQAESKGCQVVRGSEMLWEQGVGQFELWTERTAPYSVMKQVVLENCLPKEPEEDGDGQGDADNKDRPAPSTPATTVDITNTS